MPDPSPEEYRELKEDIREHGVLVPVEKDEHGNVLDGHQRLRAWGELRAEGEPEAAYCVERMCPDGGLVVDPMCGSGTTLAAALRLGRRALGCEIDRERAKVASARLLGIPAGGDDE